MPLIHRKRKAPAPPKKLTTATRVLCKDCDTYKTPQSFYPGVKNRCKPCYSANNMKRLAATRPYLKKYGMTLSDYNQILIDQRFKCHICGKPHVEQTTKKWGRARLAVDHDHDSGLVRGLLCSNCNTMLGLAQDSPVRLIAAAHYLREHNLLAAIIKNNQ